MPRDSMFLKFYGAGYGEHKFAAYYEDNNHEGNKVEYEQMLFYDKQDAQIKNFFRLPTYKEICDLDTQMDEFKQENMPHFMQFGQSKRNTAI